MDFENVKSFLEALPFNRHLGLVVVEGNASHGKVLLPDDPNLQNHVGSQHAGALFTVAEAASGAAVMGAFGVGILARATPLAKSAAIQYLKLARGPITATARLGESAVAIEAALANVEKGVEFAVDAELTDATGKQVATVRVDWYLRKNNA